MRFLLLLGCDLLLVCTLGSSIYAASKVYFCLSYIRGYLSWLNHVMYVEHFSDFPVYLLDAVSGPVHHSEAIIEQLRCHKTDCACFVFGSQVIYAVFSQPYTILYTKLVLQFALVVTPSLFNSQKFVAVSWFKESLCIALGDISIIHAL